MVANGYQDWEEPESERRRRLGLPPLIGDLVPGPWPGARVTPGAEDDALPGSILPRQRPGAYPGEQSEAMPETVAPLAAPVPPSPEPPSDPVQKTLDYLKGIVTPPRQGEYTDPYATGIKDPEAVPDMGPGYREIRPSAEEARAAERAPRSGSDELLRRDEIAEAEAHRPRTNAERVWTSLAESPVGKVIERIRDTLDVVDRATLPYRPGGQLLGAVRLETITENPGFQADKKRLDELLTRLEAGDTSVIEEADALAQRMNSMLRVNEPGGSQAALQREAIDLDRTDPRVAAHRTAMGLAEGVAATAIAPGLGSGVVRNVIAAAIDPAGQLAGGVLEGGLRLPEFLLRGARAAGDVLPAAGRAVRDWAAEGAEAVPSVGLTTRATGEFEYPPIRRQTLGGPREPRPGTVPIRYEIRDDGTVREVHASGGLEVRGPFDSPGDAAQYVALREAGVQHSEAEPIAWLRRGNINANRGVGALYRSGQEDVLTPEVRRWFGPPDQVNSRIRELAARPPPETFDSGFRYPPPKEADQVEMFGDTEAIGPGSIVGTPETRSALRNALTSNPDVASFVAGATATDVGDQMTGGAEDRPWYERAGRDIAGGIVAATGRRALRGAVPKAGQTVEEVGNLGSGRARAVGPDPNDVYEFRYRVVDLGDLIPSHTDNLIENPRFPIELQPRDRANALSKMQIDEIVNKFVPESLLNDPGTLDRGPMIIGPDLVVESGNGRVLALRRIARENVAGAEEYKRKLIERAQRYGIDPVEAKAKQFPVLVRERITEVDRPAFTLEANKGAAAVLSALETSRSDVSRISETAIRNLKIGESQSLDQAIASPANGDFVRSFIATLPVRERGGMVPTNGIGLSIEGRERIKAALLARTFGGEAGARISRVLTESVDEDLGRAGKALMQALPDLARVEGLTRTGMLGAEYAIAEDIAKAVEKFDAIRQSGLRIDDYLGNLSMFGDDLTPDQRGLLRFIADNARSGARIKAGFRRYATMVSESLGAGHDDLFAGLDTGSATRLSRSEVFERAFGESAAREAESSLTRPDGLELAQPDARPELPGPAGDQVPTGARTTGEPAGAPAEPGAEVEPPAGGGRIPPSGPPAPPVPNGAEPTPPRRGGPLSGEALAQRAASRAETARVRAEAEGATAQARAEQAQIEGPPGRVYQGETGVYNRDPNQPGIRGQGWQLETVTPEMRARQVQERRQNMPPRLATEEVDEGLATVLGANPGHIKQVTQRTMAAQPGGLTQDMRALQTSQAVAVREAQDAMDRVAEIRARSAANPNDMGLLDQLQAAEAMFELLHAQRILASRTYAKAGTETARALNIRKQVVSKIAMATAEQIGNLGQTAREAADAVEKSGARLTQRAQQSLRGLRNSLNGDAGRIIDEGQIEKVGDALREAGGEAPTVRKAKARRAEPGIEPGGEPAAGRLPAGGQRATAAPSGEESAAEQLGRLARSEHDAHPDSPERYGIRRQIDAVLEQVRQDAIDRLMAKAGDEAAEAVELTPEQVERAVALALGKPLERRVINEVMKELGTTKPETIVQEIVRRIREGEASAIKSDRAAAKYWIDTAVRFPNEPGYRKAFDAVVDTIRQHYDDGPKIADALVAKMDEAIKKGTAKTLGGVEQRNARMYVQEARRVETEQLKKLREHVDNVAKRTVGSTDQKAWDALDDALYDLESHSLRGYEMAAQMRSRFDVQELGGQAREWAARVRSDPSDTYARKHLLSVLEEMESRGGQAKKMAGKIAGETGVSLEETATRQYADIEKRIADAQRKELADIQKRNAQATMKEAEAEVSQEITDLRREFTDALGDLRRSTTSVEREAAQARLDNISGRLAEVDPLMGRGAAAAVREAPRRRATELIRQIDDVLASQDAPDAPHKIRTLLGNLRGLGHEGETRAIKIRKQMIEAGLERMIGKDVGDKTAVDNAIRTIMGLDPDNPDAAKIINSTIRSLGDSRLLDRVHESNVMAVLGPISIMKNMVGNSLNAAGRLFLANPLDYVFSGGKLGGVGRAIGAAFDPTMLKRSGEHMADVMRTGRSQMDIDRAIETADYRSLSEGMAETPTNVKDVLTLKWGKVGEMMQMLTTRPLEAHDILTGDMLYGAEVQKLAYQKAQQMQKGAQALAEVTTARGSIPVGDIIPGWQNGRKLSTDEAADWIVANRERYPEIMEQANRARKADTLRLGPESRFENVLHQISMLRSPSSVAAMRRGAGAEADVVDHLVALAVMGPLLFYRTPVNAAKRGLELLPTAGAMQVYAGARAALRGDVDTQAREFRKAAIGGATMAIAAAYYANGALTGGGPSDPAEREVWLKKNKPWSWKPFMDEDSPAITLDSLPWAIPFAVVAGVSEGFDEARKRAGKRNLTWQEVALAGLDGSRKGAFEGFLSQSFMRGVEEAYKGLTGDVTSDASKVALLAGSAQRATPLGGYINWLANMPDGMQREFAKAVRPTEIPEAAWDRFMARFPFARQQLRPELDLYGQPVENPLGGAKSLVPFLKGSAPNAGDRGAGRLVEAGVGIGQPPADLLIAGGWGIPMSREERYRFRELSGQALRGEMGVLQSVEDKGKPTMPMDYQSAVRRARETARAKLIREIGMPEIKRRLNGEGVPPDRLRGWEE